MYSWYPGYPLMDYSLAQDDYAWDARSQQSTDYPGWSTNSSANSFIGMQSLGQTDAMAPAALADAPLLLDSLVLKIPYETFGFISLRLHLRAMGSRACRRAGVVVPSIELCVVLPDKLGVSGGVPRFPDSPEVRGSGRVQHRGH